MKQKKYLIVSLILLLIGNYSFAQKDSARVKYNPYEFNYFVDVPITVAGFVASKYGTDYLRDRQPKNPERIPYLKPEDIWWFDRPATRQDPLQKEKYLNISGYMLTAGMWAPLLMYIDPKVRDIWYDYALLYTETQAINGILYLAAAVPIQRLRPFLYNPDEKLEDKYGNLTTNSFFSGHTSVVSTSSFFMVKVYYDLHPDAKNKFLFYGLACIPPAFTGYTRFKGAKHFPTDYYRICNWCANRNTSSRIPQKENSRKNIPGLNEKWIGDLSQN
jgi:hypothetical protein